MLLPPLPYHRGQKKPWPSIPRINWAHPLTRGLVSYGYDLGMGPIDLVSGKVRTTVATARITGIRGSKIGNGILYAGAASTTGTCQFSLPTSVPFASITTGGVYSYAAGLILTAATPSGIPQLYGSGDSGASTPFALAVDLTNTEFVYEFGNSTALNGTTAAATQNVYHTCVGVASPSGTGTGYLDGKIDVGPSAATTAITQATAQPQFMGFSTASQTQAYQTCYIFYGAAWNRALTAAEALQLHVDPWCFLIYPEDEMFAELVGTSAAVGWGFDQQGIVVPNLRGGLVGLRRAAALVNGDDSEAGDEAFTTNWQNVGFEVQPFQPPHPRPEKFGTTIGGDPGNEFTEIQWLNSGWEVQSVQPPDPINRSYRRAAALVNGDDANGDESATTNWRNFGFEVQSVQPPRFQLKRWASIVNGDDASGDETSSTNWVNAGWEVQAVQPPNPSTANLSLNNRRFGAVAVGDPGNEFPQIKWQNVGYEVVWPQPPHPRPEKFGSIAKGDDGFYQPTTQVQVVYNWGFDQQPVQPSRIRLQRWAALVNGDDASGEDDGIFVNWYNSGWEIQSFQPPAYPTVKQRAPGAAGKSIIGIFPNFYPWGFEVQPPPQPHPRSERSGAIAPLSNVESVFVPPVTTTPSVFESVLPTLKLRWSNRSIGARGGSQFAAFSMTPWSEVQSVQPPHPRPERSGSILRGDDGIENTQAPAVVQVVKWGFDGTWPQPPRNRWELRGGGLKGTSIVPIFPNWLNAGWEVQSVQPGHPRPERSGAVARGDDGIENVFTPAVVVTYNWGFDPTLPPSKGRPRYFAGATAKGDDGSEFPIVNWFNAGWQIAPHQPQHPRPERVGSLFGGDTGIEQIQIAWRNVGSEVQSVQPPHPRPERSGAIQRGDDGTENVFQFLAPQIVNWGYDGVWPQPPHRRTEKAGSLFGGAPGNDFPLIRWTNGGWEIAPHQPAHPRPERSASLIGGDPGNESTLIRWLNAGWEVQSVQPPHPRPEKAGSVLKGDEGIEAQFVFIPPGFVTWGYEPTSFQTRVRFERSGAIMRGTDGIESPLPWINDGWESTWPQPPHRRFERAGGLMRGDDGSEAPYYLWRNGGWEIQSVQPPRRRWERSGGIMPLEPGIEAAYVFVPHLNYFFVDVPDPDMPLKRPRRIAGAIIPWEDLYYLRVFAPVFYAKSTITPARGATAIIPASAASVVKPANPAQTIVKGEPA